LPSSLAPRQRVWRQRPRRTSADLPVSVAERLRAPGCDQEYAGRAARHGRGLLLEKPIGGDIAGAEELATVAVREKVPTMLALTWRFAPAVRRFLETDVPDVEPVGGTVLFDLMEAALGPIAGMHARGDPRGWAAIVLEHQVGRVSQASLYAGAPPGEDVAVVAVTGPRGTAEVEALGAVGPESHQRMVAEFARAVAAGQSHPLGIEHGLHLQRLVEAAETDLALHG
jgi:predicted dehydrogenase